MLSDQVLSYEFGDFCLNVKNKHLLGNGEIVPLTYKSYEVLLFLIENRERIVGMHEIINECWEESHVEIDALIQQIYRIRNALKAGKEKGTYIKTIPKRGYQFIAEVTFDSAQGVPNTSVGLKDAVISDHARTVPDQRRKPYLFLVVFLLMFSLLVLSVYFIGGTVSPANENNIKSIAVLPFEQIGGRKDEKLGLGVADTLISRLSNQDKVLVLPTNTIIRYVDQGYDSAIEVGEKLGVDAVLTGTIQRENETIRINVQLIGIKNKKTIWVDKFDEKFSNIFALQDRISRQISKQLFARMSYFPESSPTRYTQNIEAYQSYSMGLFHWNKRTKDELSKALPYFQDAVDKDPKFAEAYALLSDTYSLIAYAKYDLFPKNVAIEKATVYANKALELDSDSAEAMTTLAMLSILKNDFAKARSLLNKAIKLRSNDSTAYQRLGGISAAEGKLAEAIDYMKTAQRIDPQSFVKNIYLVHFFSLARRVDEALRAAKTTVEVAPDSKDAQIFLATVYEQRKEFEKAIKILASVLGKDSSSKEALTVLARVYAKTDNPEKSRVILRDLGKPTIGDRSDEELKYGNALVYLHLNEKAKALEILKHVEINRLYLLTLKKDYNLDSLRGTDEFNQLIRTAEKKLRG